MQDVDFLNPAIDSMKVSWNVAFWSCSCGCQAFMDGGTIFGSAASSTRTTICSQSPHPQSDVSDPHSCSAVMKGAVALTAVPRRDAGVDSGVLEAAASAGTAGSAVRRRSRTQRPHSAPHRGGQIASRGQLLSLLPFPIHRCPHALTSGMSVACSKTDKKRMLTAARAQSAAEGPRGPAPQRE